MSAYQVLDTPLPGVSITTNPRGKNLLVRIYKKETQTTINRSTGKESLQEAKQWLMENFQELMGAFATPRGGGNNSITRLISRHLDYLHQRHKAGEITESTLTGYNKCGRHFIGWFASHGYKKLGDIQRSSLVNYGLDRINKDGMAPSTTNLEIVYIRMWWTWLQDEEILSRPLRVNSVTQAVENRTGGEPFAQGDLSIIHETIKEWVKGDTNKENFGDSHISKYNKQLFALFIQLLEESGARQHEIWNRTWKEVRVGQTQTNRKRVICTLLIPQKAKRGARASVFRGDALMKIKELQSKMCPNADKNDFLFRNHQTNTLIDPSTFSRYWTLIRDKCGMSYKLHTFRSYRITELIMSGVEPQLVARNLGLSMNQIEKTYLRYTPAGHYNALVQRDIPDDKELKSLM